MYCKKCGKFIETESDYCNDCAPKEAPVETVVVEESAVETVAEPVCVPAEPVQPKKEGKVMDGFGPALASTILGNIAYVCAYVAYLLYSMDGVMSVNTYGPTIAMIVFGVIFTIVAIALVIPALVMGIKSINLFRYAVANKRVKPIPALILGIDATVVSVSAIIMAGAAFLMLIASILGRV